MMTIKYNYPLTDEQCGAVLGNGVTGEMLWGGGNTLNITLGSGNLWDHRGGMAWTEKQNFKDIRAALEAGDMDKIKEFFDQKAAPGSVRRPSLIPVGRMVITLPENAELLRYEQKIETGMTRVFYALNGEEKFLDFCADLSMKDALAGKGLTPDMKISILNSYDLSGKNNHQWLLSEHSTLEEHGFEKPQTFADKNVMGFIQEMPADPSFAMICKLQDDGTFTLTFRRGIKSADEAKQLELNDFSTAAAASEKYFTAYWQGTPQVKCADSKLEQVYYHGLFKYAIAANPAGAPPGLQGPWIEDDRLPPWQGDYHFNINVQMCMLPGLKAGKFASLKRFFDMILSWKDKLRYNAKCFAAIDNGYMLPHAVDDTAVCMGGFWTGTIDHACSSWVAQMMFDYCEYAGDMDYLRNEVYDFMLGILRVYEAMMDMDADGKLSLPVTTSPEYRDTRIDAWGKNASFQLASTHQLARNVLRAAEMLGVEPDAGALKIRRSLPLFSEVDGEIALWDGLLLEESHRHHSHLAGIAPFEVIDAAAPEMKNLIDKTFYRLAVLGMGQWVGWCIPWASQLFTRCGNADMAELVLKIWQDGFTNLGGGSLHDGRYKGFTMYAQFRGEVMQMDGGMGAITAIQDQFMHVFEGELRLFYGIPQRSRGVSFDGMYAPGGMRVSGKISENGEVSASITAARDNVLKLKIRGSEQFTCPIKAGETVSLVLKNGELVRI